MRPEFSVGAACGIGLLWLACFGGCEQKQGAHERFVPASETAIAAVAAALADWKAGHAPRAVPSNGSRIEVIDTHRRKGQRLTNFEILGEAPGEAPRCLAVRLNLANPDAELKARFVVVGIDPLWVIRHEDYELIGHWDHAMPAKDIPGRQP